jgi:hypothetical protein
MLMSVASRLLLLCTVYYRTLRLEDFPMEGTVRRVLLGITGGVAAYKAAELTRLMI